MVKKNIYDKIATPLLKKRFFAITKIDQRRHLQKRKHSPKIFLIKKKPTQQQRQKNKKLQIKAANLIRLYSKARILLVIKKYKILKNQKQNLKKRRTVNKSTSVVRLKISQSNKKRNDTQKIQMLISFFVQIIRHGFAKKCDYLFGFMYLLSEKIKIFSEYKQICARLNYIQPANKKFHGTIIVVKKQQIKNLLQSTNTFFKSHHLKYIPNKKASIFSVMPGSKKRHVNYPKNEHIKNRKNKKQYV